MAVMASERPRSVASEAEFHQRMDGWMGGWVLIWVSMDLGPVLITPVCPESFLFGCTAGSCGNKRAALCIQRNHIVLSGTDYQALASSFDHRAGRDAQVVNLHQACHLSEPAIEETEVPPVIRTIASTA
jgi:hypothetical protein